MSFLVALLVLILTLPVIQILRRQPYDWQAELDTDTDNERTDP